MMGLKYNSSNPFYGTRDSEVIVLFIFSEGGPHLTLFTQSQIYLHSIAFVAGYVIKRVRLRVQKVNTTIDFFNQPERFATVTDRLRKSPSDLCPTVLATSACMHACMQVSHSHPE